MFCTEDTIDDMALREMFDVDEGEPLATPQGTCAGEWRRNVDGSWTFWQHEDWDEE